MQFGHFDDAAQEYVITRPDTPRPWSNYLGSRRYGGIITNNAGGYSFTHAAADGRLLRFRYNSVPLDQPGRYFYLRDRDTGDYWSASWQPVGKSLDQYRSTCRFGTSYAVIESDYADIKAETTYFVPLDQDFEYWWLRVSNTSGSSRRLSVFSFAEFTSEWNMSNDLLNLQYSAHIVEAKLAGDVVSVSTCGRLPRDQANFGNRDQSRWWWMAQTGAPMSGYDLDREAFIGPYRSFHNPAAVERGLCLGSEAYGDNACGAIQSDIELAPGETRSILVLLGVGKADRDGAKIIQEFATPERAQQELVALKRYWHGLLESLRCDTPDDDFDHMVNVWNAYNAMITFTWSRACSLVYTGENRDGLGYRDSVQDAMGVVSLVPAQARERLELMFAGQESTGGARPEIKPWLHKPGHMPPTPADGYRSDDCLWFFNAIPAYLGETGDVDFLQLVLPYSDCGEDTVFAHLRRALEFNLERTGQNGLPCGLQADWNDCLKLGYRGESVFVAFQVRFGLGVYADLAQRLGLADQAAWANQQRESLDSRIQAVCWDGSWFIWAVAEDGTVYGSKNYPEGQVYLNTQVWSVLSGAANPSQAQQALASVHQRLATPYGIMLCDPPFEKTSVNVMRAVLFNPGCKENAGIFCHTQSWAVMAECMMGNGDRAYEYYRAFMPSAYNDRAEIRQIEPFVHCQSTHGSASPKFGVSRLPWLSGTASWSYYAATQWILGIRPEIDGLRIDPCIPRDWQGFTVNRRFRGMNLHIVVRNESGAGFGVKSLALDGQSAPPGILPTASLRDGCHIDVVL